MDEIKLKPYPLMYRGMKMTIEDIALCVGTGCIYIGTSAFFLIISAFFTENVCEILAAVIAKFLEWLEKEK